MKQDELIAHCNRLAGLVSQRVEWAPFQATNAQVIEFLSKFSGAKSSFTRLAAQAAQNGLPGGPRESAQALLAFAEYLSSGLVEEISSERRAQLDVVSDLLEQAHDLIENAAVHPAAPAVLVGATLEEFLRTWVEAIDLPLGNHKPGIETYVQTLRQADLISKQDAKDITAWGGLRNHAAHGEWDLVGKKANVSLMLQGVNLFMRKYESGKQLSD